MITTPFSVTHIITGLEDGGAEGALYRLLEAESRAQEAAGSAGRPAISHRVISLTTAGVYGERIRALGVPVICLGMPRGRVSLRGLVRLFRSLRPARHELVQTWMYHADLVGGLVARLAGVRAVVWGIRHSDLGPAHASRSLRFVARACALLSRCIPDAAVSCSTRAVATHRAIGYRTRFSVIPNGYDLSRLQHDQAGRERLRQEWNIQVDVPLIGMVARYNPQKDHAALLHAAASLDRPVKLVLVGSGCDADNAALLAAIEREGLTDRVILAGRRDDIPAVMSALDVHVLSSSWGEAFPNVLAEAMACATPCVTTDVGDAAEIVGETGWVVPPGRPDALAGAIAQALAELRASGPAAASPRTTSSPGALPSDQPGSSPQATSSPQASSWEARRRACAARIGERFTVEAMRLRFRAVWLSFLKTRLMLVAPSMRGGGAERVIAHLARALDRGRFSLSLLLVSREGPFLSEIPCDVPIVDLGASRARYALARLIREVRRSRPDTVLSTLGYLNLLLAIARPLLPRHTRFIAREANTVSVSNPTQSHPRLLDFLYRRYYRRFDRVVCQSRSMADDLSRNYRVSPERISVIYNPVDVARIRARTGEIPAAGPLRLIAVGRLVPQKGYDLLLRALEGVRRDWRLVVLGDGPLRGDLERLAGDLGLSMRVRLPGFSEDPEAEMARSHVLLLSSRYEGLPNVVLEAGAIGLPTIAFDCPGGTAEVILPGVNGELVPCEDVAGFTRAIERFEPSAYDAETIRAHIARHHAIERIAREYEAVLEMR